MATPGLKDCDREPPLRPFLPSCQPIRAGWFGHVRHSFAAALGTTDIPSVVLARCASGVLNSARKQAATTSQSKPCSFRALIKL
jgi:hypothetical protein